MKSRFLTLLMLWVSIVAITPVFATDYVVPVTMSSVSPNTFPGIGPGDRLLVLAGNRGPLQILNLRGEPGNPIVIINSDGRVNIDASWVGIWLRNCKYIKLSGKGVESVTYGFLIADGTNQGVFGEAKTEEIEVEYVEVTKVRIGITVKTNFDINDNLVSRNSWTQYNTTIHHCYIHDVEGEAIYVGSSHYDEGTKPLLNGVYIHDNIITSIGFDGIQVGSATNNVEVHDNTITDVGLSEQGSPPNGPNSQDGIVINKGSVGTYYNNRILNPRRNGITAQGLGPYNIYDNEIINAGCGKFGGHGIKIFTGNTTITNNTIISSAEYGIFLEDKITTGTIHDNTISWSGIAAIKANGLPAGNIYNNKIEDDFKKISIQGLRVKP